MTAILKNFYFFFPNLSVAGYFISNDQKYSKSRYNFKKVTSKSHAETLRAQREQEEKRL